MFLPFSNHIATIQKSFKLILRIHGTDLYMSFINYSEEYGCILKYFPLCHFFVLGKKLILFTKILLVVQNLCYICGHF